MRSFIIILLLSYLFKMITVQAQDFSDKNLYGKLNNGLPKRTTSVEIKHKDVVIGVGNVAVSKHGVSNLRVGYWKEYSENGTLKMEGNYKLSSYINCGIVGHVSIFYYYRDGLWKIYDDQGKLKYELTFSPSEFHINTSCEGGDRLLFGIVKQIPLKYWGQLTSQELFQLQQLKITDDSFGPRTWVPLNGEIFIEP